jgi:hypothetical protein
MSYNTLLSLHSIFRWFAFIALVIALVRAWYGWKKNLAFSNIDKKIRMLAVTGIHIQMVLGVWLYFESSIVSYFLHNFNTAVHQREIRFFGMEHITMMVIAVTLITIGSAKSRRAKTDHDTFKAITIWFGIGLLIIFFSIPWKFSPLTSRPYWRPLSVVSQ